MSVSFEPRTPQAFSVVELLMWIDASKNERRDAQWPPLTLPPLQRNSVWRPKQVLDLWRSVLEGMPIGLFYLQAAEGEEVIDQQDQRNLTRPPEGALNLFDGQQRVRTLALGAGDPYGEERSIWIRFVGDDYELILSSKTQPAGYKSDGGRFSIGERREWLEAAGRAKRPELLWMLPPLGCAEGNALRLADLLRPALLGRDLTVHVARPISASDLAWTKLSKDVGHLAKKCAVFVLLPEHVAQDPTKTLDLFRRVGAGDTPLTQPEQIYSAYKLRRPEVRLIVETVHRDVASILTPAQIVQAALRMAHTRADPRTGWPPGFDTAIKELSFKLSEAEWVRELDALVLVKEKSNSLINAFRTTRRLLEGSRNGSFYLPEIVMAQLPAELWQVLAFWALPGNRDETETTQVEVVRFAMAWHLAVTNQERAAQVCFRNLVDCEGAGFPGEALFKTLIGSFAHAIPRPEELDCMFRRGGSGRWLTYQERFKDGEANREVASSWWFGRKMLPWLQRGYLGKRFKDYRPLSDHEDDRPYDWDHICPQADWKPDGRKVWAQQMGFSDDNDRKAKMGDPGMVGDSIGNFRLVDFSQNRSDGAKGIFEKMRFLEKPGEHPGLESASDFLLDDDGELALWRQVDKGGSVWDDNRRAAFQQVVEHRTARLYKAFYYGLGFESWTGSS